MSASAMLGFTVALGGVSLIIFAWMNARLNRSTGRRSVPDDSFSGYRNYDRSYDRRYDSSSSDSTSGWNPLSLLSSDNSSSDGSAGCSGDSSSDSGSSSDSCDSSSSDSSSSDD